MGRQKGRHCRFTDERGRWAVGWMEGQRTEGPSMAQPSHDLGQVI